jgi:hypothetical protein
MGNFPFNRRESGYCSIEWSTPAPYVTQNGYFSMSGIDQAGLLTANDAKEGFLIKNPSPQQHI